MDEEEQYSGGEEEKALDILDLDLVFFFVS